MIHALSIYLYLYIIIFKSLHITSSSTCYYYWVSIEFFRSDLAYFDGLSETILCAGLVKPKPGKNTIRFSKSYSNICKVYTSHTRTVLAIFILTSVKPIELPL